MFADVFTIGFARRATPYKRPDLLFHDLTRLLALRHAAGPIQVVYAGTAYPRDSGGRELIRRVFEHAAALRGKLDVVYLEDHDMALACQMVTGVDLWLDTPLPPLEASGTSGMKAAVDGERERCVDIMKHAIALNASFFDTERMVDQYVRKAYFV